jgi:hypothetical protein
MVIAHRVLVLDTAAACNKTRFEEHCFGQRGLAASVGAESAMFLMCFASKTFMRKGF